MSASPYWMDRSASPIELAALAHAVATAKFGPLIPCMLETWPLAEFTISFGMVNGETLSIPLWSRRSCCVSNSESPPIPEPITTPQRYGSSFEKSSPESVTASAAAAMANCVNRSSRRNSFELAMFSASPFQGTSPANCTRKPDTSNSVIGPTPLSPRRMRSQNVSTALPNEVTTPRPVTTTRRFMQRTALIEAANPA